MSSIRRSRSGYHGCAFTLVEIVVVIAIVGIVAALTLSAVQAAREAARLAACVNNLRQIGIGIHAYATTINAFPQGMNGAGYSIHAMLLPHIDQRPLYDSINFQHAAFRGGWAPAKANETAAHSAVSSFICPSDALAGSSSGSTSYAGNRGSGVQKYGYNGAFALESQGTIGFQSFTDGTAQTAALSEWLIGDLDLGRRDGRRATFETPIRLVEPSEYDAFVDLCQSLEIRSADLTVLPRGRLWMRGEMAYTLYNHMLIPNANSCTNRSAVQEGAWTVGSLHPGRAAVLFADGHTSAMHDSIAIQVWRALGSRNGRDDVAEGEF